VSRSAVVRRLVPAAALAAGVLQARAAETQAPVDWQKIAANCRLSFGSASTAPDGSQILSDYVDLDCGEFRLQADTVTGHPDSPKVSAQGNVSIEWRGNRIAGSRMDFDLDTGTGTVESASGLFPPDALVTAARITKAGDDLVLIEDAHLTSCTRPVPDWSLRVKRGRLELGGYAHLYGVSVRVGRAPVFALPWLLWPLKGDRATGFLLPSIGGSSRNGWSVGDVWFWEIADNADLTAGAVYHDEAGLEGDLQMRWLPTAHSALQFDGRAIDDRIADDGRWAAALRYTGRPGGGWRLLADARDVSDFAWYTDFPRRALDASTNATVSTLAAVRPGPSTTLAFRAQRRDQYFTEGPEGAKVLQSDLLAATRPEIEWRGRARRIGRTPFTFAFESSATSFLRRERTFDPAGATLTEVEKRAGRGDAQVRLAMPLSPTAWLDVESAMVLRETYYSNSLDASGTMTGESLSREFADATVSITGPKFSRIFGGAEGGAGPVRVKHAIEPTVMWNYSPEIDEAAFVPVFDEIDLITGDRNVLTYGLRQRLIVRRPVAPPAPAERPLPGAAGPPWGPASLLPPEPVPSAAVPERESAATPAPAAAAPPPAAAAAHAGMEGNPVDVASLEILQSVSFDEARPLSFRGGRSSTRGPVRMIGRLNPSLNLAVDLRADWDPITNGVVAEGVAIGARHPALGFANLNWSRRAADGSADPGDNTVSATGGTDLWQRRVQLAAGAIWDAQQDRLVSRGLRVGYYTQCCGFLVEYARRDFIGDERREWRFSLDLRGIGNLLDFSQGSGR